MSDTALTIRGFADALGAALGIKDRFGSGHAVALLDAAGRVIDLTAFTADHHTIDTALDWANCLVLDDERISRMVLISAVRESVRTLREADVATLRSARQVFGGRGIEVLDWIQVDGEDIRSLAFATEPDAWSSRS